MKIEIEIPEFTRVCGVTLHSDGHWQASISHTFTIVNIHGQSIGDIWGFGRAKTPEAAWSLAIEQLMKRKEEALAYQNSRAAPYTKSLQSTVNIAGIVLDL